MYNMDYTYRVYTTRTIGVFSNKDDAISLLYNIKNSQIEVFKNLTPIGIYTLKNNELYLNNDKIKLEGFMNTWYNQTTQTNISDSNNELKLFIP